MAAELGLLSMTQRQNLRWTTRRLAEEDNNSWAVRAFAEDTGSAMGATWPPRSYTCTFCRREFRSAQALGGHMNVHRRDRARLRQSPQGSEPSLSPSSTSPIIFPSQELVAGSGLCLFYPIPNPVPSTLLSMAAHQGNGALNLISGMRGSVEGTGDARDGKQGFRNQESNDGMVVDEIDLELRLGW